MVISIKDLEVKYDAVVALNRVSLKAASKNVSLLLGANGAGKSSFVRSIKGLVPANAGEICLGDKRIDGLPAWQICGFAAAIVPEGRRVFPTMTVLEN